MRPGRWYVYGRSKGSILVVLAVAVVMTGYALYQVSTPRYPQNTGIVPQVVECVRDKPEGAKPSWKPTVRVKVEPVRLPAGGGRIKEYHAFGCTFYYYYRYFR
jgi:hypothetical protein